ncbi:anti-sigma factor antagonist [Mycolicibacterium moriokaense]|nr:anti-sigma factor antagonist [Mycolicibacterium moriokaense]
MRVTKATVNHATVLTVDGVLDSTTYRPLRDEIIKAALAEPAVVLVDFSGLDVPAESALAVFTSARWHVRTWPEVPIALVCRNPAGRNAIARNGVSRYVPVYESVEQALEASSDDSLRYRRRAKASLDAEAASTHRSRQLMEGWLTAWSRPDLIAVSKVIVTTFVENVLEHTESAPTVRLESEDDTVTVAVEDGSRTPPSLSETRMAADIPTGLKIVDALSRVWGSAPTPTGKTVWAVIGPENRL